MARPTKLDPVIAGATAKAVARGLPVAPAAFVAGVGKSTVLDWLRKGRAATAGKYRRFYEAVVTARGEALAERLDRIQAHAAAGHRGAQRWLKSRGVRGTAEALKALQHRLDRM